jgi:DtxR family Mn-dependent transcriptional regulator
MTEFKKFPIPSAEQEDREEALGLVWYELENGRASSSEVRAALASAVGPEAAEDLIRRGLARDEGGRWILSEEGERLARDVTRRHRLAERLLVDVLGLDVAAVDPDACQWEHVLSVDVSSSICTLLGHPRECPHGLAIPPGDCCRRDETRLSPIVVALDQMAPGDAGHVAYLRLQEHPELHKLLALGVVPGTPVRLHQTYPAYVVDLGETQLALEAEVARYILVRRG